MQITKSTPYEIKENQLINFNAHTQIARCSGSGETRRNRLSLWWFLAILRAPLCCFWARSERVVDILVCPIEFMIFMEWIGVFRLSSRWILSHFVRIQQCPQRTSVRIFYDKYLFNFVWRCNDYRPLYGWIKLLFNNEWSTFCKHSLRFFFSVFQFVQFQIAHFLVHSATSFAFELRMCVKCKCACIDASRESHEKKEKSILMNKHCTWCSMPINMVNDNFVGYATLR